MRPARDPESLLDAVARSIEGRGLNSKELAKALLLADRLMMVIKGRQELGDAGTIAAAWYAVASLYAALQYMEGGRAAEAGAALLDGAIHAAELAEAIAEHALATEPGAGPGTQR